MKVARSGRLEIKTKSDRRLKSCEKNWIFRVQKLSGSEADGSELDQDGLEQEHGCRKHGARRAGHLQIGRLHHHHEPGEIVNKV